MIFTYVVVSNVPKDKAEDKTDINTSFSFGSSADLDGLGRVGGIVQSL
jgi:hypothetical protein